MVNSAKRTIICRKRNTGKFCVTRGKNKDVDGRLVVTSLEELHAKPKRKTLSKGMAIFESND